MSKKATLNGHSFTAACDKVTAAKFIADSARLGMKPSTRLRALIEEANEREDTRILMSQINEGNFVEEVQEHIDDWDERRNNPMIATKKQVGFYKQLEMQIVELGGKEDTFEEPETVADADLYIRKLIATRDNLVKE